MDEAAILAGHFAATAARFAATTGTILVLHDTTEFRFARSTPDALGYLSYVKGRHAKRKRYGPRALTAVYAFERGTPAGRGPIRGERLTDLPVADLAAAVEKRDWYAMRWGSETDHKVLKSGGRAEQAKLRTAERLTNLLAVLCVVGWRVFWLTLTSRVTPTAPPEVAFTPPEIAVLDRAAGGPPQAPKRTISRYLLVVAKLGGYLARAKDPPPGNLVVWRGLTRLADILLGSELHSQVVGN